MATGTRLTTRAAHKMAEAYGAANSFNVLLLEAIGASDPGSNTVDPTGIFAPEMNTVADVMAISGVTELVAAGYSRQAMSGWTATESDDNRWSVLAGPVASWAGLTLSAAHPIAAAVLYTGTLSGTTGIVHAVTNTGMPFTVSGAYSVSLAQFLRVALA